VWRIRFPDLSGFEEARQAWAKCWCAARSAILAYAQARETCRRPALARAGSTHSARPEIAAAFFEPNSPHYRRKALIIWVATSQNKWPLGVKDADVAIIANGRADDIRVGAGYRHSGLVGGRRAADGDHAADTSLRGALHDGIERVACLDQPVKNGHVYRTALYLTILLFFSPQTGKLFIVKIGMTCKWEWVCQSFRQRRTSLWLALE